MFIALTHASGVHSHLWGSWRQSAPGPRFRVIGTAASTSSPPAWTVRKPCSWLVIPRDYPTGAPAGGALGPPTSRRPARNVRVRAGSVGSFSTRDSRGLFVATARCRSIRGMQSRPLRCWTPRAGPLQPRGSWRSAKPPQRPSDCTKQERTIAFGAVPSHARRRATGGLRARCDEGSTRLADGRWRAAAPAPAMA